MSEFYHVARNDISSINKFELMQIDRNLEHRYLYSIEEFEKSKLDLYNNNFSKFGQRYLDTPFPFVTTKNHDEYIKNDFIIEIAFELVRRLKFPEKKSRFVSYFGCLSLEDAQYIKHETFKNNGIIYKVECENFFKADMSLVNTGGSILGIQILAEKYWSSQASKNPFWEILMEAPVKIIDKIE